MKLLYLLPPALFQDSSAEGGEEASPPSGLFGGDMWILIIAIVAIFYFVMIAPEKKNRKKRENMLGALKKGDKIMTTSGMYGAVAQVQEDVVTVQVADGVRLRFSRTAIQTVIDESGGDSSGKDEKAKA